MLRKLRYVVPFAIAALIGAAGLASAQTPDGETPAEEESCTKYEGEGARHGLCIAYCEAQDCEGIKGDESCERIERNFITYSQKKGYTPIKPKPGRETIDCRVSACTSDDIRLCGGKERDCVIDGECTATCTSTFEGYTEDGKPLCAPGPKCKICSPDRDCDEIKVCELPPEQEPEK